VAYQGGAWLTGGILGYGSFETATAGGQYALGGDFRGLGATGINYATGTGQNGLGWGDAFDLGTGGLQVARAGISALGRMGYGLKVDPAFHGMVGGGFRITRPSSGGIGALEDAAPLRTNFDVYEVLSQQPITGTTRAAHRASANGAFYEQLEANPDLARYFSSELGTDVMAHMASGKGPSLLNPPGSAWHHPVGNPTVMQLLRKSEHSNPLLRPLLHPGPNRTGGFGTHFSGN
jgi:hypothetical protein